MLPIIGGSHVQPEVPREFRLYPQYDRLIAFGPGCTKAESIHAPMENTLPESCEYAGIESWCLPSFDDTLCDGSTTTTSFIPV